MGVGVAEGVNTHLHPTTPLHLLPIHLNLWVFIAFFHIFKYIYLHLTNIGVFVTILFLLFNTQIVGVYTIKVSKIMFFCPLFFNFAPALLFLMFIMPSIMEKRHPLSNLDNRERAIVNIWAKRSVVS